MPAIKAYKHNGKIIPVDQAKVGRAYQCPWTSDIYSTKAAYVKHLKLLRQNRMWANARRNRWQRKMEDFWNQPNFESIIQWVDLNPDVFWQNGKTRGWHSDAKIWDKIRDDFWIRITYLNVTHSNSVSNTHDCPHNGETNWGGDKPNVPRGYPGWSGRIEFQCSHDVPSFFSNIFEGTRIHTGTGGGISNNRYGYSVKFFEADWPGMTAKNQELEVEHDKKYLLDRIQNKLKPFHIPGCSYGTPVYFK